jgi:plasmid stability protein
MTSTKPGRDSDQFALRLPDGMRDRIKASAAKEGRSMNAEIVHALDFYFAFDGLGEAKDNDVLAIDGDDFIFADTPEKVERAVKRLSKTYERDLRNSMLAMLRDE